jgi:hypothetical protein
MATDGNSNRETVFSVRSVPDVISRKSIHLIQNTLIISHVTLIRDIMIGTKIAMPEISLKAQDFFYPYGCLINEMGRACSTNGGD